tara:strand:+ start:17989 stop:18171 length:183 start_codon:yes stop_codon:yes gene_type:complete
MNTDRKAVKAAIVPKELKVENKIKGTTISGPVLPEAAFPKVLIRAMVTTTVIRQEKIMLA